MKFNSAIHVFESFIEHLFASMNLKHDTLKVLLTTSEYTPDLEKHRVLSDIPVKSEVSGPGYARQELSNRRVVKKAGQIGNYVSLDADDVVFRALGGDYIARRWVLYDEALAGSPLIATGLIDPKNKDVAVTDGNTLTLSFNDSGVLGVACG